MLALLKYFTGFCPWIIPSLNWSSISIHTHSPTDFLKQFRHTAPHRSTRCWRSWPCQLPQQPPRSSSQKAGWRNWSLPWPLPSHPDDSWPQIHKPPQPTAELKTHNTVNGNTAKQIKNHVSYLIKLYQFNVKSYRTAPLVECWTHDQKVVSLSTGGQNGRIFLSRINCLCRPLFRPRVTTVAHNRLWSLCQKCRCQVTPHHAYTHDPTKAAWELIRETSSQATHQGTPSHSHLSSMSHCGLILA